MPVDASLSRISIDQDSHVPAYHQIYEALRGQLGSAALPPGTKLATERTIADAAGVSRQTVRQAFARLEREGLLSRRRGDGTYVAEARVETSLRVLRGFTSEISARGLRVRSRVHDLRLAQPPAAVCKALALGDAADSAIMLRRTRILDGIPATLETVWLSADLCGPILDVNMTDRSLYATLRELVGIEPRQATERLSATALDEFEAHELDQPVGAPALLVERTTRDGSGRVVEVVKSLLRADRFTFRAELDIEGGSLIGPAPVDVRRSAPVSSRKDGS